MNDTPTRCGSRWAHALTILTVLVLGCASSPTVNEPAEIAADEGVAEVGDAELEADSAQPEPDADGDLDHPEADAVPDRDADVPEEDADSEFDADAPEPDVDAERDAEAAADADATTEGVPATYLALGDSYTIGESVEVEDRWPVQLVEALRSEGAEFVEEAPVIVARTGWTTADLSRAMDDAELAGPYAMVSLLIGVNNQFQGRSVDEYREQLGVLLDRAIQLAGDERHRVLVLSIPDWGATPFAARRDSEEIARAIDLFNGAKREECEARDIVYVDITDISREAPERPELVAGDGLHPSGVMYAEFVVEALPFAREILASPLPN